MKKTSKKCKETYKLSSQKQSRSILINPRSSVWHCKQDTLKNINEKDKQFFLFQRNKGHPGSMGGVDVNCLQTKERKVQRKGAEMIRLKKSKLKSLRSLNYNDIVNISLDIFCCTYLTPSHFHTQILMYAFLMYQKIYTNPEKILKNFYNSVYYSQVILFHLYTMRSGWQKGFTP